MKTYYIWYTTPDGDNEKCWVSANNSKEAVEKAKQEYWNIKTIDFISEK